MPINQLFPVFTTKVSDLLKTMVDSISPEINNNSITDLSTPADLEVIKSKIFKKLWQWESMQVFDETIIKDYKTLSLSYNEANQVLTNFSFSISSRSIDVLYIEYGLRIEGNVKALKNTVKNVSSYLNIKLQGNIIIFYKYCQGTIEQCAPNAKTEKVNVINLINSNQKDVNDFFSGSEVYFKSLIEEAVQKAYNAVVDKKRGLDLL